MHPGNNDLIKHREILFMSPQREQDPAAAALALLNDVDGILSVSRLHPLGIRVSYQLTKITLNDIEDALQEIGFHLDNSVLSKLKRALFYFAEDTHLANLGYDHAESKSTLEIFINRHNQLPHGCRDERPAHFRHYS
ncbi:MAG TPA: hypothetical protein VIM41_04865 [Gammaproteobacteria bacterium]